MTHTMITVLGKVPDGDGGYKEATYRFPNGATDQTPFFGFALARHLQPDRIVILGTSGSSWSVLVDALAGNRGDGMDAREELNNAGSVQQPLLDRLAPLMGQAMNASVEPKLIPNARDEAEQHAILEAVDAAAGGNTELHFDLTHGFRHLGMVGFLSAFMLERLRGVRVRGLWYGALDMTADDGVTPVLRLDGLLRVRRWLDALGRFDATGDYGVFAPLLKEDGVAADQANCLEAAAFLERTLNVRDAAREIGAFLPVLDERLPGASGLFQGRLSERLRWARAHPLWEQQRKLAHQYLNRGDFVRAAMFGKEACASRVCEQRGASTFKERELAVKDFEAELNGEHGPKGDAYWTLTHIRNALAHGTPPPHWARDARNALQTPSALKKALQRSLERHFS